MAQIAGWPQWGGIGSPVSMSTVGESLYGFYGYICDGYYKDLADIQNSPKPAAYPTDGTFNRTNTVWPGDIKFKDLDGNGIIDENDRTNIGSPMPDFTFGLNNSFRYKNFDLSLFIAGSIGNKILNYTSITLSNMSSTYNNQLQYVKDHAVLEPIDASKKYDGTNNIFNWFDDITNVRMAAGNPTAPRAISNDPNSNARISDRYIEDGSYLRVKNITVGYTLPSKWTKSIKIENVRAYVNIQNLWTITGFTGMDPEVGVNTMTPNVYGMDYGRYPSPTVYTFGVNLSF
jgi:hypothetical protein